MDERIKQRPHGLFMAELGIEPRLFDSWPNVPQGILGPYKT